MSQRELKWASVRRVRPGEHPPGPPGELEKVCYHLQAALEDMRLHPIGTLPREQFRTWIYQLIAAANDLVCADLKKPGSAEPGPDEDKLLSDLKDIIG